jgi:Ni/Co efflux regulator RcnB
MKRILLALALVFCFAAPYATQAQVVVVDYHHHHHHHHYHHHHHPNQ